MRNLTVTVKVLMHLPTTDSHDNPLFQSSSMQQSMGIKLTTVAGTEPEGRRPNGFLGLSLNDRTILFLVDLLDKTVSV